MKYRIVTAYTALKLEEEVNDFMQRNWEPIGGVSVARSEYERNVSENSDGNRTCETEIYAQALILK